MIDTVENEFSFDLNQLDRRKRIERILDNLITDCLCKNIVVEAEELIESYLAVIRSRNNLRRNWHPAASRHCDVSALHWICSKNQARSAISKSLQDAITITSDGTEAIHIDKFKEIEDNIMRGMTRNRKKSVSTCSLLERIVRQILKSNPDATQNEVIQEIINDPNRFSVVDIDEEEGIICIEDYTKGKKNIRTVRRSLSSIGNTLTKIRKK
jgi:hypothetical protein